MRQHPLMVLEAPAFSTRHANPYNALLSEGLRARGVVVQEFSLGRLAVAAPHVVHVHWPELLFLSAGSWWRVGLRVLGFWLALSVSRWRRGTVLVWTVHNVLPHDAALSTTSRLFWRFFVRQVDGLLTLSEVAVPLVRSTHPRLARTPVWTTPHVDYRSEVDHGLSRAAARDALGLPAEGVVALCVGQVRRYKGVPRLLAAFSDMPDAAARLVIAGRPESLEVERALHEAAAVDGRVHLDLGMLPADRISTHLRACDLVVLSHQAVMNSGAALLALSADRPVLVPALGALTELAEQVGERWVMAYEGSLDTAVLRSALAWAAGRDGAAPDLSANAVSRVAALTEAAFEESYRMRGAPRGRVTG